MNIVVTFGVRKAEIIPIEPDTVNTGEGKCKMFMIRKLSDQECLDSLLKCLKQVANSPLLTPYASIFKI